MFHSRYCHRAALYCLALYLTRLLKLSDTDQDYEDYRPGTVALV